MNFNKLIFRPPKKCNYDSNLKDLYLIPKDNGSIPILFKKSKFNSNKIIIFYHGNSDDLSNCIIFYKSLKKYIDYNFIAVEYPGYGLYKNTKPTENIIKEDCDAILSFCKKYLNANKCNITVIGISLGTGPACYISSKYNITNCILISPYLSIKHIFKDKLKILSFIVKDKFENYKIINKFKNNLLFIHGRKDSLININHSLKLFELSNCKLKELKIIENMDHYNFNLELDIIVHINDFLIKTNNIGNNDIRQLNFDILKTFKYI